MAAVAAACAGDEKISDRSEAGPADTIATAGGRASVARADAVVPTVVFIGTSLTAGYGLAPELAYPAIVGTLAAAEGLPIRPVNAGVSGETSAGALRRLEWVLRTPADVVVVETGANDALRGLDPDSTRANLERIVTRIRRSHPQAEVLLVQMEAPPNYGAAYVRRFRAMYRDVAREHDVRLAPFLLDGVAGLPELNQADGIHPNRRGAERVARNVWKSLKPVLLELRKAA